jgi:hypothetical protein
VNHLKKILLLAMLIGNCSFESNLSADLVNILQRDDFADLSANANANFAFNNGAQSINAGDSNGVDLADASISSSAQPLDLHSISTLDEFSSQASSNLDYFAGQLEFFPGTFRMPGDLEVGYTHSFGVGEIEHWEAGLDLQDVSFYQRSNIKYDFNFDFSSDFDLSGLYVQLDETTTSETVWARSLDSGSYNFSGLLPGVLYDNSFANYRLFFSALVSIEDIDSVQDEEVYGAQLEFNSYLNLTASAVPEPNMSLLVCLTGLAFLRRQRAENERIKR